tara:strand:+ start:58 stop:402 length:345 start_codon:yes stop_codon:yes gene_type:complete
MATLPNIEPSYPVRKTSKPIAKIVQFGDGYQQRFTFGLNQNPKTFALTWDNLSETDSDTLEAFLDARASDQQSFDYTPPNEPSQMKFICQNWNKNIKFANRATISATFVEVFEA